MCTSLDKGIKIREVVLEKKTGGKSGDYVRAGFLSLIEWQSGKKQKIPQVERSSRLPMPANVTVLLVDDNPMIREMLRQSLANINARSPLPRRRRWRC